MNGFTGYIQQGDNIRIYDANNPSPMGMLALARTLKARLAQPEQAMFLLSPATYADMRQYRGGHFKRLCGLPVMVSLEVKTIGVRRRVVV